MSPQASEGTTSSASPRSLIEQTVAPSSTVEDQLRKEIAGLKAEIRQLKLNQDPSREGVKHALIQEELAQIRETILNLRVELQVAQDVHRLLEQKHHALENEHERCKGLMQKAVENLSTGLEPSNGESTNLGLPTEGVAPNAVQIKEEDHSPALLTVSATKGLPVQAKIFGQPSIHSHAVQPLSFTPGAFLNNQHIPKSLFTSSTSAPTPFHFPATTPSPADGTAAGSPGTLQVKGPAPPMFGDPKENNQHNYKTYGEMPTKIDPDYWKALRQGFEGASRMDNKLYTAGIKPPATPRSMETFHDIRASAPRTSGDSPSSTRDQEGKKRKIDNQGGWEGGNLGAEVGSLSGQQSGCMPEFSTGASNCGHGGQRRGRAQTILAVQQWGCMPEVSTTVDSYHGAGFTLQAIFMQFSDVGTDSSYYDVKMKAQSKFEQQEEAIESIKDGR